MGTKAMIPLCSDFAEKNGNGSVCIFGTGDFGRSLGSKLLHSGYSVIFGSRTPGDASLLPRAAEVLTHAEAAQKCSVVIVAVQRDHYDFLKELEDVLEGKILVDVSNNLKMNQYSDSNAEHLAQIVPRATVVKAFNTVSAWALQSGSLDASRQVFVCSDDNKAKQQVMDIIRAIGLTPQDKGSLVMAKEIEDYPLQLFPMWRLPMYICAGLTVLVFLYCVISDIIYNAEKGIDVSYNLMMTIANRIFPVVSLMLLALCYLPGVFAAIIQLYRGTKYSRFPDWLDRWMLCRKQLGLVALSYAFLHAIYTLAIPIRYIARHRTATSIFNEVQQNTSRVFEKPLAWRSDTYIALGILGFFFYVVLGITSLPSVSNAVNWREFRFVQSKLGYLTLVLSTGHAMFFGWNRFLLFVRYRWYMPPVYMLSLVIPCVVLILKLILIIPCIDTRITRIRQGWERSSSNKSENKIKPNSVAL